MKTRSQKDDPESEKGLTLDALKNAIERFSPRLWAERHVRTERGSRLTFADRPWLEPIYDDPHPRMVIQKSAQVGITIWGIGRALHLAAVHAQTVIFTMPTQDDARSFVRGRVNRMIDASPTLRRLTQRSDKQAGRRTADNAEVKYVGEGIIYFRGTQTEGTALSIPADALFHDEVDRSHPETLEMYGHTLVHCGKSLSGPYLRRYAFFH